MPSKTENTMTLQHSSLIPIAANFAGSSICPAKTIFVIDTRKPHEFVKTPGIASFKKTDNILLVERGSAFGWKMFS